MPRKFREPAAPAPIHPENPRSIAASRRASAVVSRSILGSLAEQQPQIRRTLKEVGRDPESDGGTSASVDNPKKAAKKAADMTDNKIPCPFVYASGRKCSGHVDHARAYGPTYGKDYPDRADVSMYRLWCTKGWDHRYKMAMEFRPQQLSPAILDQIWDENLFG